jgi:hypothetical protein
MSAVMRAKMMVNSVVNTGAAVNLSLRAVAKNDGYPSDGRDENNTFAFWTPNASVEMTITNPDLFDKFQEGQTYYVDFTSAT